MDRESAIHYLINIRREAMHGSYTTDRMAWSLFDSISRFSDYALNALGHTGEAPATESNDEKSP